MAAQPRPLRQARERKLFTVAPDDVIQPCADSAVALVRAGG